jgi:hypothetical protein
MWFRTSELAGLPGLPGSIKGLIKKAQRENWETRDRRAIGGGKEYHISSLPPETQQYLLNRTAETQATKPVEETEAIQPKVIELTTQPVTETLVQTSVRPRNPKATGNNDIRIDARLDILRILENFCQQHQLKKVNCHHIFANAYNKGEIQVSTTTKQAIPNLSPSSLQRWVKTLETGSVQALCGNYGNRKGQTKIDVCPKVREFVLGMLTQYPHCTGKHLLTILQSKFEPEILPSQRTLERWIASWREENKEIFTAVSNPDAWKSKYMSAFGSYSDGIDRLNQLWEMDSTPADIMLSDGRYHLIGCIDVYSRRTKLLLVPRSKAVAIATLLRQCLLDWGVPEQVKTDNGKDYTANHLQRLFAALEIKQKFCEPFQPWQKPHIERFFRTFAHDLVELLPGFIGHNVAERQELRARESFAERLMTKNEPIALNMSAADFQNFANRWCDTVYAHQIHEGLEGSTPFEIFTNWRGNIKRIANERALDILLAEAPGSDGLRVVQKRGIQLEGTYFIAPDLEAWIGKTVQVRLDPMDLGKIYVFDGDFNLICIAQDPARTGINRQEVAVKARAMQKERVQEGRQALKKLAKKVQVEDVVEAILDAQEEKTNVVPFPQRGEIHDTKGLQTAAEVVEMLQPKQPKPMTADELAAANAAFSRIEQQPVIIRDGEYFCKLWKEIQQGKSVAADDAKWMLHFMTTPEGRGTLFFLDISEEQISSALA